MRAEGRRAAAPPTRRPEQRPVLDDKQRLVGRARQSRRLHAKPCGAHSKCPQPDKCRADSSARLAGPANADHPAGSPGIPTATLVVTPASGPVTVLAAPGGAQIATLPTATFGAPTWVPVLASQTGWYQVQLPGPPNGLSGWIPEGAVNAAMTPWLIVVSLSAGQLTIYDAGRPVLVTPAAYGAPSTPTPPGRTYLAGDVAPVGIDADLAPVLRPVGWHTDVPSALAEFPGGTIAIHGWNGEETDPALWAADGHGRAVSHGCIRLPASAAQAVALVPNGSPAWIEA